MKIGDRVISIMGWEAKLLSAPNRQSKAVMVRWETGPLEGREARLGTADLRPVSKKPPKRKRLRIIRDGKEVQL